MASGATSASLACGVLDFEGAGLGDPAINLAAVSWCGKPCLRHFLAAYPDPAAPVLRGRARCYWSTHAL